MHSHCNSSSSDSGFSFLIFLSKCIAFQLHSIPMAMHSNCIAISIALPFQLHCHFNCIPTAMPFQWQCHSNGNSFQLDFNCIPMAMPMHFNVLVPRAGPNITNLPCRACFPCLAAQKTFFSYRNFWNKEFHFLKGKKLAILKKMAF